MSLTQWFTRSPPTVEWMSIMMATFSLVPTPSALETRIGSLNFFTSSANSAPKLPMPPSTPLVNVRVARWRMRLLASSATAIFTPASAYLMNCATLVLSRRGRAGIAAACKILCPLENVEQPSPAHRPRMDNPIQVGQEPFADFAGLPGLGPRVQGHVNEHRSSDDVVARHAAPETRIEGVLPVVAHREIAVVGNLVGHHLLQSGESAGIGAGVDPLRFPERVRLEEPLPVDPDRAVMNVNHVAGQTNRAFHVVGL